MHAKPPGENAPIVHECTSHREGDWVIFRCPVCPGYERRFNWITGEMHVNRGGSTVQHSGVSTREQNMEALTKLYHLN